MNVASTIRPPAVAGLFYPGDPTTLKEMVGGFLREFAESEGEISVPSRSEPIPKAIIAPHAGFIYSGSIAGSAYGKLARAGREANAHIRRVILLGPSHRVLLRGLAATSAAFFATPLGDIRVDREAIDRIANLPQVGILDEAHASEHSLEVHLPFLREVLEDFMLVPLVVGEARPEEVAEVLERLWDDEGALVVVSTDLSHYLAYDQARERDSITAHAIETLDTSAIHSEDACGRSPVNGLLYAAKHRGMVVERLDLRSSGDTAGDKARVVGYGAWAFFESEAQA